MPNVQVAGLLASLATSVAAHGYVQSIVAGTSTYTGYNPSFQYQTPAPVVAGWSDPEDQSNGFISPSNYTGPDIICHLGATPGKSYVDAAAGDNVTFQWNTWPESHHGPVITYLANCGGDCTTVDKTKLEFVKVDAVGLVTPGQTGTWATDNLIAANNSWTMTIPESIAPGNYVARHEIIALHSAGQADGAQNYPQCINMKITGSGSESPAGTLGEKLYTPDEPGISINIYTDMTSYPMPGPTLWSGAGGSAGGAAGGDAPAAPAPGSSASATGSSPASVSATATATAAPSAANGASSRVSAAAGATGAPSSGADTGASTGSTGSSGSSNSCKRKRNSKRAQLKRRTQLKA
ncbi:MAG: hypothetical protein Q9162_004840 [Coniocarpon cinnabarinum]